MTKQHTQPLNERLYVQLGWSKRDCSVQLMCSMDRCKSKRAQAPSGPNSSRKLLMNSRDFSSHLWIMSWLFSSTLQTKCLDFSSTVRTVSFILSTWFWSRYFFSCQYKIQIRILFLYRLFSKTSIICLNIISLTLMNPTFSSRAVQPLCRLRRAQMSQSRTIRVIRSDVEMPSVLSVATNMPDIKTQMINLSGVRNYRINYDGL